MVNYTREQLSERYKSLPQDVQEAIIGVETADILQNIGNERKMMIDKIGELAEETGLVMLGFTHPSQFVSHLSERLGIEKSVAKEIAEEVNTKIFFPIRENLKKIHGLREEEAEEKTEVSPRPTSLGLEIKPPETPVSPQMSEEKMPTAPTPPSPLPSVLMPEPVVLETTILPKPETKTSPSPLMPFQPETILSETPVEPVASIFEAKTKEEGFRLPAEATEKIPTPPKAGVEVDPYREPTI